MASFWDEMLRQANPSASPGEGGPGGPGTGPAGSSTSGIGLPGVGPTDGTTTGTGNMSLSQSLAAFGQGAVQGIPGVALGSNIANAVNQNSDLSLGQIAQMGLQGLQFAGQIANGVNPASLLGNITLRGLMSLAGKAQDSTGVKLPTFADAMKEFTQNLKDMTIRSFFGLKAIDDPIPDTTFPEAPTTAYPDMDVNFPDVTNPDAPTAPSDSGIGPGIGGNPGGEVGEMFHGGPVYGPPGRDRVPVHLTRGEYVIDADSARHFRDILETLNRWEPRQNG